MKAKLTRKKEEKVATRHRILSACVKLFLEQGYYKTTLSAIVKEADVSFSSFQNIFHTKDGVLLDLTMIMFENQFEAAREIKERDLKPVYVYATETAVQMTLTELNESLREIYVEAYSQPDSSEYIYRNTTTELVEIFSAYNPTFSEGDFYELDIGTSGIMRGYMARKCDQYFTLEKKITRFLSTSLKVYNVPEEEIKEIITFVLSLDIKGIANNIMHKLFKSLAMKFDFSLDEIENN